MKKMQPTIMIIQTIILVAIVFVFSYSFLHYNDPGSKQIPYVETNGRFILEAPMLVDPHYSESQMTG